MFFENLQPVSDEILQFAESLSNQALGKRVVMHTKTEYPNLENISIALICVNENRGANIENEHHDFNTFRKSFYSLFPGNWNKTIADLGDILIGNEISDTYFVLKTINSQLIKQKIIPIIVGGSQDLTYALYRTYDNLDQMVNLVAIDNKFDFANKEKKLSDSYLSKIIVEEPNNLYNFSSVGYQTYFTSQEELDLIEKLYFEAYRLGEIIKNSAIVEPVFRDADIISLDMKSVKSADSGNTTEFYPNGFDGREICTLARYAGISDKVSTFGIFNQFFSQNENELVAQIVWYFIEGYHLRSYEYPFEEKTKYNRYIVLAEDEELVFYKSNRSERWWMEINFYNIHNKTIKKTLLPCTNDDYLAACNAEIPERWWKAYKKSY